MFPEVEKAQRNATSSGKNHTTLFLLQTNVLSSIIKIVFSGQIPHTITPESLQLTEDKDKSKTDILAAGITQYKY